MPTPLLFCDTVFCQIHAQARTPKNTEGCVYSGIIRSKSNDVGRLRGFPNLQFRFLWRENRVFMRTQLTEIKWLLVIFVTVISCERALFLAHLWGAYAIPVVLSGVRRPSFVVRRVSSVSTITTRNN